MPKFSKKKSPFADLDEDFTSAIEQMGADEIRKKVAQISFDTEELLKAKEDDQDLKEKAEAAKEAGAVYREGLKMNRLRIKFCKLVLEGRGEKTAAVG